MERAHPPTPASDVPVIAPEAPDPPRAATPDRGALPTPALHAAPVSPERPARKPAAERRKYDRSIVEGPLAPAVWKIAWPTMLTNIIGGLQGIVDHVMVGRFVDYTANAGIGVAIQIWIVVIVFIMSVFTGMSVMVARFVGANEPDKADRVVYQAFLVAVGISLFIMAPLGTPSRPRCWIS